MYVTSHHTASTWSSLVSFKYKLSLKECEDFQFWWIWRNLVTCINVFHLYLATISSLYHCIFRGDPLKSWMLFSEEQVVLYHCIWGGVDCCLVDSFVLELNTSSDWQRGEERDRPRQADTCCYCYLPSHSASSLPSLWVIQTYHTPTDIRYDRPSNYRLAVTRALNRSAPRQELLCGDFMAE